MIKQNIKDLLSLIVPQYALIPIITTLMLFFISSPKSAIPFQLIIAIGLYIVAVLAFNAYNMAFDKDIDNINKPNRPIPAGRISAKIVAILSSVLFIVASIIGFFIAIWLGIILILFFLEAILYSTPPFRLRKYFLFHNINATLIFAVVPLALVIFGGDVNIPIEFSFYIISLLFCSSMIKDFEDIVGEKKVGIKTIPNVLGIKKASLLLLISLIAIHAYLLSFSLFKTGWNVYIVPSVFGICASFYIFNLFYNFVQNKKVTINSRETSLGVGVLLLIQLLFLISSFLA